MFNDLYDGYWNAYGVLLVLVGVMIGSERMCRRDWVLSVLVSDFHSCLGCSSRNRDGK